MIETPVLVVGGGPAGLASAIELGWRGIDCTVLEEGDGSVDHPRLGIILTRTMEICRRWGIVDQVYNCGFQKDYRLNIVYCTSLDGYLLGRDENPSCEEMLPPPQSPEKRQRCPQIWFNPLLERAAASYPSVDIRHFSRLESFRELSDCVEADVCEVATGKRTQIRAKYMIACDGAASTVRRTLGVGMDGNPVLSHSVNLFVRSPEMVRMHGKGEAERYIFVGPNGTWANMTVVDGRELWRFTIIGSEAVMNPETFDPHLAIRKCMGRDDIPYELISTKYWRRSELTAQQFKNGRIFLAGDAAHTMSPTGGHGMSTGVADAVNLGWKLEAVLKGWAGPALLDSYDTERRPVSAAAAAASAENFRAWVSASDCSRILDDTPEGETTRQRIGGHMRIQGRQDWDSLGLQLGYCYDNSPICIDDGTPPTKQLVTDYIQTSMPGARAPHAWLPDGTSTLDLFGRGFVLLRLGQKCPAADTLVAAAAEQNVPLQVVDIEDPEIARLYERALVLVRPDGHVAWRGDSVGQEASSIISVIRGALIISESRMVQTA
jgi:2-polyprenyl-6-methoxyphenol hydroxylase-like FAD-dependent oxidoreductase